MELFKLEFDKFIIKVASYGLALALVIMVVFSFILNSLSYSAAGELLVILPILFVFFLLPIWWWKNRKK